MVNDDRMRPFRIEIPDTELNDLRARLAAARWPAEMTGAGWERGVPLAYLKSLAAYWGGAFDWRAHEARLNELPQFITEIDGQPIHFLHLRASDPSALPLLLIHSWPGSFVEFARLIEPLGGAFHLVIPSIPGFGFSTPVTATGWDAARTARAFAALMRRLGYERYGVHGGDVGAAVAGALNSVDPEGVTGVHVTSDPRSAVWFASFTGATDRAELSEGERARLEALLQSQADGMGYLQIQSTRPQTLAYLLTDSPTEQLAWIVEKFKEWTDPTAELPEDAVDRDQLLVNISIYWFTRSGASAAHFLYENMNAQEWLPPGPAPTGFAVFGQDSLARKLMDPEGQIAHWSEFERGGHFPAMETPDVLAADIRTFFGSLK